MVICKLQAHSFFFLIPNLVSSLHFILIILILFELGDCCPFYCKRSLIFKKKLGIKSLDQYIFILFLKDFIYFYC